jgi:hypothetical protein
MIRLTALKPDDLDAFRNLMGSSDFGGCFCAVWTSYGDDWESRCGDAKQPNFFATAAQVNEGRHVGYLVYEDDKLVGWTGAGPKTSFPLLKTKLGSRLSAFAETIWGPSAALRYRPNTVDETCRTGSSRQLSPKRRVKVPMG